MGPCTAVDIEEVHVRLLRVHFSSPIAAVAVAAPASASFCHEIVKLLPLLALSTRPPVPVTRWRESIGPLRAIDRPFGCSPTWRPRGLGSVRRPAEKRPHADQTVTLDGMCTPSSRAPRPGRSAFRPFCIGVALQGAATPRCRRARHRAWTPYVCNAVCVLKFA